MIFLLLLAAQTNSPAATTTTTTTPAAALQKAEPALSACLATIAKTHWPKTMTLTLARNGRESIKLDTVVEDQGFTGCLHAAFAAVPRDGFPPVVGARVRADEAGNAHVDDVKEVAAPDDWAYSEAYVAQALPAVRACYARVLREKPGLTGRAFLSFDVDEKGAISNPMVPPTQGATPVLSACATQALSSVKLTPPTSKQAVQAHVYLTFSATGVTAQ